MISREGVERRLVEAVWVLGLIKDPSPAPRGLRAVWPDISATKQDYAPEYAKVAKIIPTSKQIDRCLPTIQWISLVENERNKKILWAALVYQRGEVSNIRWSQVQNITRTRLSRQRLLQIYKSSLSEIAKKLEKNKKTS